MIINKHKDASEDYTKAYNVVNDTEINHSITIDTYNKKAFRKYLSEMSKYAGSKFVTRSVSDNSLKISRIE